MQGLLRISRIIDAIDERLGKALGWLILLAVLISAINAIVRFSLNRSSNAWLELQWYLFGAVFLLGAAYTFLRHEHIRIDIVNARLPKRVRDWIDLCGHLFFLMPLCAVLIWSGTRFAYASFMSGEVSSSAGGLILWPAKIMVPLCFLLLAIQGFSEIVKRVAAMRGLIAEPYGAPGHGDAAPEVATIVDAAAEVAPNVRTR